MSPPMCSKEASDRRDNSKIPAIQRIPPEIFGEIFIYCMPHGRHSQSSFHPNSFPILLCHVCRTWRTIAMALPKLWTNLIVVTEKESSFGHPKIVQSMSEWFSRAARQPISLTFRLASSSVASPIDLTSAISTADSSFVSKASGPQLPINVLDHPLLHRVDHLALELKSFADIQNGPSTGFPLLESLVLRYSPMVPASEVHRSSETLTCLSQAPSLRRACLYEYIPVSLPWSQLTHLVVCFPVSSVFCEHVLSACLNLRCVVLVERMTPHHELSAPPSLNPVVLPDLSEMDIAIFPQPGDDVARIVLYPTIFRFCSTPTLSSLRLVTSQLPSSFNPSGWPAQWRSKFYEDISSVKHLTLNICPDGGGDYAELFRALPDLEELTLELYESLQQLPKVLEILRLETLDRAIAQTPLLPKLSTIACRSPTLSDDFSFIVEAGFLSLFMEARASHTACAPISKLVFVTSDQNINANAQMRKRMTSCLAEWLRAGFQVDFQAAKRIWYDAVVFSNDWSEAPTPGEKADN